MSAGTYKNHPITPADPAQYQRGLLSMKEGATETFKKGAPLIVDADGFINVYAGGGTVFGIAAEDAHNVASDGLADVLLYKVFPGERWLVVAQDSIDQTDIGDSLGLVADGTTGVWYLDEADGTDEMYVLGIPEAGPSGTAIGDTIKYVYACFLQGTTAAF